MLSDAESQQVLQRTGELLPLLGGATLAIDSELEEILRDEALPRLLEQTAEGAHFLKDALGEGAEQGSNEIDGYTKALRSCAKMGPPSLRGVSFALLGHMLLFFARANAEDIEGAFSAFSCSLACWKRETHPRWWAYVESSLGRAYATRQRGEFAENVEAAIEHFRRANQVYTRELDGPIWAGIHREVGRLYGQRVRGELEANRQLSIRHLHLAVEVFSEADLPVRCAMAESDLALAHMKGSEEADAQKGIGLLVNALEVLSPSEHTRLWGHTHHRLGLAYLFGFRSERAENVEASIEHFRSALKVFERPEFSAERAMTQQSLARAYSERLVGQREDNVDVAIRLLHEALTVDSRSERPVEWASEQYLLGRLYLERMHGDRRANLERAIECLTAALEVYTPDYRPALRQIALRRLAQAERLLEAQA